MSETLDDAPEQMPGVERDLLEIEAYERSTKNWRERGDKIIRRYRDDRGQVTASARGVRKFNILWSNVQVLQPALYARRPVPVVERRFRDEDPVGREAAETLERATTFSIDTDLFDRVMRMCRDDRLLPGRGTAWVSYRAEMGDDDLLENERVEHAYVDWVDFGHNVARTWEEVYLVWRRVQMTRDDLVKRFPGVGDEVPLDARPRKDGDDRVDALKDEVFSRAWVYEMWDSRTKEVRWISKSWPKALDVRPDPLGLQNFFPCPRPLYSTLTNESLIPTPDFSLYQDQAAELDDLNTRIARIVEACKVVGVYDGSQDAGLTRMLTEGTENKLFPIKNWAGFAQTGGMKGAVDWLPLDMMVQALPQLTERFQALKQEVYEITGIADIVRGSTEASETATAQQIKGRYAALRLTDMQAEVARFARDLIGMTAEIISEHFDQRTIFEMAQKQLPTQAEVEAEMMAWQQAVMQAQELQALYPQAAQEAQMMGQPAPPPPPEPPPQPKPQVTQEQVMAVLRDDLLRTYKIEIETDSTIALDEAAEKEAANEFITAFTEFQVATLPLAVQAPEMLPTFKEMALYGARRYRSGRSLEGAIESSYDALIARAQQMQANPAPDPAMVKADAEVKAIEAKTTAEIKAMEMKTQAQLQAQQMKTQGDLQAQAARAEGQVLADQERAERVQ